MQLASWQSTNSMASDNTSLTSNKRLKVSLCLDSDSNQNIPQSLSLSYHQQHQSIIQTVLECEMHLFTPEEHLFFALYQTIPKECQNMHFRILNSRTWKWERISSLLHETNNSQVLNQLSTLNLPVFQQNGPESIADWISLLSKSELMQICQIHKIKSNGTRRGKLSELLVNFAKSQSSLSFVPGIQGISTCDRILATVKQTVGPVLKLDATTRNLFFRLYTIYFRSRRWPSDDKWMTASILSNLSSSNAQAKRVHQAFKVVRSPLFWPSRVDLLEYFDLIKLEFEVDCILKRNTTACWESVVKDTNCSQEQWLILKNSGSEHCSGIQWLQVYTPYWVLTRILGRRYEALFRLKRHHECIELLKSLLSQQLCCLSYRGRWYNELVRLVENYRDKDEARQLCKKAVADSHVLTGNLQSLRKRLARLCKGRNASASMQFEPLAKPNEESIYGKVP